MKTIVTLLLLLSSVSATTYYIAPSGSDSNSGTSSSSPFKTFSHAIPLLNAGDTLNLLSGTYQPGTGTGFPNINCSSGAHSGSAGSTVTIQALNERQAWLKGDGSNEPFRMSNCSYWNIVGLHVSDGDFASEPGQNATMDIQSSNHIVVKRSIFDHNDRCFNTHLMGFFQTTSSQVLENEFYYFHRHAIIIYNNSNGNEIARNYSNSRAYPDSPTTSGCSPFPSSYTNRGDDGIINYGDSSNTFENNISEGNGEGFNVETITNSVNSANVIWLGNISLNDLFGLRVAPHTGAETATGMSYSNNVIIHASTAGSYMRQSQSTISHGSYFLTSGPVAGVLSDPQGVGGTFRQSVDNTQVIGATSGPGFEALTSPGSWSGGFDHVNSFGNGSNFSSGGLPVTNATTVNPSFGGCYLWIPDSGSPLKGAGSGATDLGATVLFQYSTGTLTATKLWDGSNGSALFAGATVSGLNDVAGSSLFDIANRLNIGKNGCSFPASYGGTVSRPNPPTGLTAIVH